MYGHGAEQLQVVYSPVYGATLYHSLCATLNLRPKELRASSPSQLKTNFLKLDPSHTGFKESLFDPRDLVHNITFKIFGL